jgi:hypothetical protein
VQNIFLEQKSSLTHLLACYCAITSFLQFSHLQEEAEHSSLIFFLKGCFGHLTSICIISLCAQSPILCPARF